MDEIISSRIEATRVEVESAKIPSDRKDGLQRMLDHAAKCAGEKRSIEDISVGVSDMIVHIVRNEAREPTRTKEQIEIHASECKIGRAPKNVKEFFFQIASQYPILVAFVALLGVQKYGIVWLVALWNQLIH